MKSQKSSQPARLMGSQTPSVRIAPESEYSDGTDAAKILSVGRMNVDPWQCNVLEDWMGRTASDQWAASTCGLSGPKTEWENGDYCRKNRGRNGDVFGMGDLYCPFAENCNRNFYGAERIIREPQPAKVCKRDPVSIGARTDHS